MQKTKKNISSKPKKVVNVKKEIKVDKKENKNIKVNVKSITTRDGLINKFDLQKIRNAIFKAFTTTDEGNEESTDKVLEKVVFILNKRFNDKELPSIENIQDIVEESLMLLNYVETAKNYILYREQRRRIRESKIATDEAVDIIDEYLRDLDWEVKENSNTTYSLQSMNNYVANYVAKKYWLNKIYTPEIRKASRDNFFHIHDLGTIGAYCCGWDLYDLLKKGFGGVPSKIQSRPAKHFRTALGQVVNYFYTLQGEVAGAQAFSNFDTYLAPFIRYDRLNENDIKQALQEFIFNCNVPTRVGFQTPFTNVTCDLKCPNHLKEMPVVIGGELQKEKYGEFQMEMDVFNRMLCQVYTEGDASGRVFTFPIPTYNITKDFEWDNPAFEGIWQMTAKYGLPYFSNFINSEMSPEDARSMCCRLRLDNRELYKRGGGLFGANPKTGSLGVVTLNLPRIAYISKTKSDFFKNLRKYMDLAKDSLEIKRKTVENLTEKGLYPYSRYYLQDVKAMRGTYWANHFSTIGLVGGHEMALNFIDEGIESKTGQKFIKDVLDFMRDVLVEYQKMDNGLYNLEATPAEGTSYRLARIDKKEFPDIITAGTKDKPYYTNSTQLPVNFTDDLFEALDIQDSFQTKYTGGTVLHGFIGEEISNPGSIKSLLKKVFTDYKLPYLTVTPTFSVCPVHGYIAGEHHLCPKCVVEQKCEVYSRVVGYIRPVSDWHEGKKQEFGDRITFTVAKSFNALIKPKSVVKKSK